MNTTNLIIVFLTSYLIGSIPFGLIIVKLTHKIDIRTIGSGNIGATNVLRAGYPLLAFFTLLYDSLKGAMAVSIFKYVYTFRLFDCPLEVTYTLAGIFVILGHIFPIWLKFKGGKGVATAFGSILVINPIIGIACITTWLIIAILFKYSSLAAIISFILLPFYTYFFDEKITIYTLIISIIILFKHKSNIINLLNKKETKIKFRNKNGSTK